MKGGTPLASETHIALREMKQRIDDLEKITLELKEMGRGIPVIDKNCTSILSTVYNLKFGISDIAKIDVD